MYKKSNEKVKGEALGIGVAGIPSAKGKQNVLLLYTKLMKCQFETR